MKKCPLCSSESIKRKGSMKTKRGSTKRYQCKECSKTFTKRTLTQNYRHRLQHLRDRITGLYCEGMSLRAISRYLKINVKTVMKYFLENANMSKVNNLRRLDQGQIVTAYVQFDELETFEHTKRKPLGVECSIRVKTGEIISAKVCTIPVKALAVSSMYIKYWNKNINRQQVLTDMLIETKKAMNKENFTIACDNAKQPVKIVKTLFDNHKVQVFNSHSTNKKIDSTFLKMRQDISRLRRRTLATTKKRENLQKHLDLYTDYHNMKRIA